MTLHTCILHSYAQIYKKRSTTQENQSLFSYTTPLAVYFMYIGIYIYLYIFSTEQHYQEVFLPSLYQHNGWLGIVLFFLLFSHSLFFFMALWLWRCFVFALLSLGVGDVVIVIAITMVIVLLTRFSFYAFYDRLAKVEHFCYSQTYNFCLSLRGYEYVHARIHAHNREHRLYLFEWMRLVNM